MSANAHDANESDGAQSVADGLVDDLARSFTIGTDAAGMSHHYFRPADAVVVWDPSGEGGVDDYRYLEGGEVLDWMVHVAEARGWESKGPHAAVGVGIDARRKGGDR